MDLEGEIKADESHIAQGQKFEEDEHTEILIENLEEYDGIAPELQNTVEVLEIDMDVGDDDTSNRRNMGEWIDSDQRQIIDTQ